MKTFPPFDPSVSDGCTFVRDLGVRACCVEHDRLYWFGRTEADRLRADKRLRACIASKGGLFYRTLSHIRYAGVRLFGRPAFYNKPHKQ